MVESFLGLWCIMGPGHMLAFLNVGPESISRAEKNFLTFCFASEGRKKGSTFTCSFKSSVPFGMKSQNYHDLQTHTRIGYSLSKTSYFG